MKPRWFKTISLASTVLLGITLALTIAAFWLNPWEQRLSITDSFHIGVFRGITGDAIGRIVFFNDSEYGPYGGSIVGFAGDEGNLAYKDGRPRPIRHFSWSAGDYSILRQAYVDESGEPVRRDTDCDLPGIYYRHYVWPGTRLWTLMVSFWYPLILFALLPGLCVSLQLMRRGRHTGHKSGPPEIPPTHAHKPDL